MVPRAGDACGLNNFLLHMKRERAARDECQTVIMQQIMMRMLFIAVS